MKDVNQPLEPFPKTPEKIQAASEATGQGLPNLTLPPDPSPGVWEGGRMGQGMKPSDNCWLESFNDGRSRSRAALPWPLTSSVTLNKFT